MRTHVLRLPLDSNEMKAFVACMLVLSRGVPVGTRVQDQGLLAFKAPDRRADMAAGGFFYDINTGGTHDATKGLSEVLRGVAGRHGRGRGDGLRWRRGRRILLSAGNRPRQYAAR